MNTHFISHQNMALTSPAGAPMRVPYRPSIDYRRLGDGERTRSHVLAYSAFEWIWVILLVGMVAIASVFAVFLVTQLFRNPGRR
jgi:hypothetical protein